MDRRDFLKRSISLGLGASMMLLPKGLRRFVSEAATDEIPHLIALKGNSPEAMFDRGIAALGGIERFVRAGQTVVVKPNISFSTSPEMGSNTSPALVARIIKHCLDAGAKRVWIMDHSIEYWERSYETSGIGDAVKAAGGIYVPSNTEGGYQRTDIPGATALPRAQIHESILECDVLISVPALKHHGGAGVSISAKNLMGCVWNRREYHSNGLQRCIADFLRVRRPDLNVVDASRVITRNGPRGGSLSDVAQLQMQILSPDVVAADAAAAMLLGREPKDIGHIRYAAEAGLGEMDLSRLRIERMVL